MEGNPGLEPLGSRGDLEHPRSCKGRDVGAASQYLLPPAEFKAQVLKQAQAGDLAQNQRLRSVPGTARNLTKQTIKLLLKEQL